MIASSLILALSQVLLTCAIPLKLVALLMIARLILGVSLGAVATHATYLAEISQLQDRGYISGSFQVWSNSGNLVSMAVSLEQVLGRENTWHYVSVIGVVFSIFMLFFVYWLPESPAYLIRQKKISRDEVVKICQYLHGSKYENIDLADAVAAQDQSSDSIRESSDPSTQPAPHSYFQALKSDKTLQKCLIYQSILSIFAVLSGTLVITAYSTNVIKSFNFPLLQSQIISLVMIIFKTLAQGFGCYCVRNFTGYL